MWSITIGGRVGTFGESSVYFVIAEIYNFNVPCACIHIWVSHCQIVFKKLHSLFSSFISRMWAWGINIPVPCLEACINNWRAKWMSIYIRIVKILSWTALLPNKNKFITFVIRLCLNWIEWKVKVLIWNNQLQFEIWVLAWGFQKSCCQHFLEIYTYGSRLRIYSVQQSIKIKNCQTEWIYNI